jgi:hypothetical protein
VSWTKPTRRWKADKRLRPFLNGDFHRRVANFDPGAIELAEYGPPDAVFYFANTVLGDHEADGEFQPVVGYGP